MRFDRSYQRERAFFQFNATPMVDVFFILTIFFMLVSRFLDQENVPMLIPEPTTSQARIVTIPDQVVINCRLSSEEPGSVLYSLGPNQPQSLGAIAQGLAAVKEQNPEVQVIIRADRRLSFKDVRPVMRVVADNNIRMLNVVAHVGEEAGR